MNILDNYDVNFNLKKRIDWKKVYNNLIIIGNVLFVLMMIRWALGFIFHW